MPTPGDPSACFYFVFSVLNETQFALSDRFPGARKRGACGDLAVSYLAIRMTS